jgi:acyl carrier protein
MVALPADQNAPAHVRGVIERLLEDLFELDVDGVGLNTRFNDDLGMDSLHVLALVAELEDVLQIEVGIHQIADVATVAQAVDIAVDAMREG